MSPIMKARTITASSRRSRSAASITASRFTTRGLYLYVDVVPNSAAKVDVRGRPDRRRAPQPHQAKLKDDVVDLLPVKKTAIEAGGFVGVTVHGVTNPYGSLSAPDRRAPRFRKRPQIDHRQPQHRLFDAAVADDLSSAPTVGTDFVSNRFADYYFSINPAESFVTGLPDVQRRRRHEELEGGSAVNQSMTGDLLHGLGMFGTVNYSRLVGDFKRSPIVSERGSANQWLLAAGLDLHLVG